jgi:acetoacetate decarboxylase
MELDEAKAYLMPLIMGPAFDLADRPQSVYGETRSLSATFKTDPEAVRSLVPACFSVPDEPTVTVAFGDHSKIDFMAGDGYRVAYVGVSAGYRGDEEINGLYILIMWENQALPIVLGRELIGIPKLAADITPPRELPAGGHRATASLWGHEVMRLELAGLKEQNAIVRRTAQRRVNGIPWFGYKHIPSLEGPPDASYPTVVWNEIEIDQLSFAQHASVSFGGPDEDDVGQLAGVTRALRTLPIGEMVFASRARGSAVLRIDRSRRLH